MDIIINNTVTKLPSDYMTLNDLAEWKGIKPQGTAIAVNGRMISKERWVITKLSEHDRVTIISAAFGG